MKEEEEKCKANAEMAEPLQQTQEQGIELEDLDSPHNETNLSNDGRHLQVPSADHSKKLDIDPEPIRVPYYLFFHNYFRKLFLNAHFLLWTTNLIWPP